MKRQKFGEIFLVTFTVFFFLFWKLNFLTFRFGDESIYFYIAKRLLEGGLPYRDYFFADPPFMLLGLSALRLFFGNHLLVYRFLPVLLEISSALLLYFILKRHKVRLAFLAPTFYLFSFTVFSTSDYLSGQLAAFLMILAFWFYEKEKPVLSGVFWSCAVLTKMYVAPALLGFLAVLVWQKKFKEFWRIAAGGVVSALFIWGPFFLTGSGRVLDHTFFMHFRRPSGLNQSRVWTYFLEREWLFGGMSLGGVIIARLRKHLWIPFLTLLIFLIFFRDVYYNYFEILSFFLILFSILLLSWVWEKRNWGKPAAIFLVVVSLAVLTGNLYDYQTNVQTNGRFLNAPEVAGYVRTLPPRDLYGAHETAPLVALLADRSIFGDYIALGSQAYDAGIADKEEISQKMAEKGVYLISRITDLPQLGMVDSGYRGYFSQNVFKKTCLRLKEFPSTANDTDNKIVIYECRIKPAT